MTFLDPKCDIAFKKIFSNQSKKEIAIDFLNSVLERAEGEKIVDITFSDPSNHPDTKKLKYSIVDARCVDQKNKNYILEMQVDEQYDYAARSQYYCSLGLSRQLDRGDLYQKLTPVIFIGILDFNLFASDDHLSHHLILNKKTQEHALNLMEFHFIELKKFKKSLEQLETIIDKWIYFFRYASKLESIPQQFKDSIAITHAMEELEEGRWSRKEIEAYDRYVDAMRVERSVLTTATLKGVEKGLEQGREETTRDLARRMLGTVDLKIIAQVTGLSIDEIENLKK